MKPWISCGALCLSLFPTVAFGQSTQEYKEDSEEEVPTSLTADSEDGGLEDATAPEVMGPRPPTVLDAVSVDAPESMELTEPMSVELSVVVEADGSVSEVDVLEGDSSLGEIAQDAMRRFVFRPAQLADGTTARARIRYRFDFAPPPPPAAGALLIEVRDALDQPVVGATVRVTGQENTPMIADFDSPSGTFRYVELPVGTYRVEVTADGYAATRSTETVDEHVETAVILRLTGELALEEVSGNADEPVFGETAVVEAPPREVLRRSISGRAAASVAGTRGDALRAVEVMPGVARPPFGSGQLILRGSAPADSQVFLDGVPVPLLYHFGGLTSFLPSPLVD
ncbi:MAG: TonB family protein, partial [Myxococcota bacterium]